VKWPPSSRLSEMYLCKLGCIISCGNITVVYVKHLQRNFAWVELRPAQICNKYLSEGRLELARIDLAIPPHPHVKTLHISWVLFLTEHKVLMKAATSYKRENLNIVRSYHGSSSTLYSQHVVKVGVNNIQLLWPATGQTNNIQLLWPATGQTNRLWFPAGIRLLASTVPKPAQGSTQSPIQWVPAVKRPEGEADGHLHRVPRLRMCGPISPLPLHAFTACS
jgi:hypothetical protein